MSGLKVREDSSRSDEGEARAGLGEIRGEATPKEGRET